MYVWKCFGDSVAFAYLDPFSIKHMFFDTVDYGVKQDAGALSGKSGITAEKKVFLRTPLITEFLQSFAI